MSSIFTSLFGFRSGHGILLTPIQKYLNYTLKSGEYLKLTIPCISLEPDKDHQFPPCYIHLDMTYFVMVMNNGSITFFYRERLNYLILETYNERSFLAYESLICLTSFGKHQQMTEQNKTYELF